MYKRRLKHKRNKIKWSTGGKTNQPDEYNNKQQ